MRINRWAAAATATAVLVLCSPAAAPAQTPPATASGTLAETIDWPVYGGQAAGDHYSRLAQIDRSNVKSLREVWRFDTGEKGGLETSPIIVGRVLYAYTPKQEVLALDAASGKLLWKFASGVDGTQPARGVAYWTDGHEGRVLAGVMNYLYALDPATGKPISSFGEDGRIDLRKGLRGDYRAQSIALTTPGIVYKDIIIVGGRDPETYPAPPGDIRAFDVRTGALRWQFHTIPHRGEVGYETWPKDAYQHAGAANNWAGMALDPERGIVYVPTGSAVADFYGADRAGDDLFANTLLALDANTGKRLWHFQGVKHDTWDRDFPSPPALVTVMHKGKRVDAVAQTTKQGFVYLFDRSTGEPLFPIEYHNYPASTVPGEVSAATQPLPLAPAPYARQRLTADMLTKRTPAAHAWAAKQFTSLRSEGQFIPFSVGKGTIVFPGYDGGAEWGGPAVDPTSGVLYVNANEMAWTGELSEVKETASEGARTYGGQCAVCHGDDRQGSPPAFPSLVGIDQRLSVEQIEQVIHSGQGRMPAFPNIADAQLSALMKYLHTGNAETTTASAPPASENSHESAPVTTSTSAVDYPDLKYQFTGYHKFLDPDGYPAIAPPWGTLSAIDLNTGKYLWHIPIGEYPELAAKGMKHTGTENYGGPVVTASGLLFIGATVFDNKFHAFDARSGKLLWETTLPFAGVTTPATYMVDGKQYVVIACGGKDARHPTGGMYVAFALP